MARSAGPALTNLYAEHGHEIAFVTLYVREAHPGNRFPQPRSFEQKLTHARAYADRDQIPWPVAVDDLDGTLHRALDSKPNAAYIMDLEGNVAYRLLASNGIRTLRQALHGVTTGKQGESQARLGPALRAARYLVDTLNLAGHAAVDDVQRESKTLWRVGSVLGALRRRERAVPS